MPRPCHARGSDGWWAGEGFAAQLLLVSAKRVDSLTLLLVSASAVQKTPHGNRLRTTNASAPQKSPQLTTNSKPSPAEREREKFIIRQPPIGEKDDYYSKNLWISDELPSSSRRRRRGEMRGEGGEWSEKWSR